MVISVKELHQRRRSSIRDGKLTHVRVWLVTTDDIFDGTAVALLALGVPRYGDPYPGVPSCIANSIDAEPVQNSGRHFEVTVEYTSGDIEAIAVHPLERAPDISWSASESTEPYFLDCSTPDPKPVTNSAGDPFEQFMERERGELTITYTSNVADFDAADADDYSHTVNVEPVVIDGTVYAPGTLKLSPIQAEKMTETWMGSEVTFYRRTCTLKARRQGWLDKPLDVGLNQLIQQTESVGGVATLVKKIKPIIDRNGSPVRKPYPLDGVGKARLNPTDKPAELEFKPYRERSWSLLAFE